MDGHSLLWWDQYHRLPSHDRISIDRVYQLASDIHGHETRKVGGGPYINHPLATIGNYVIDRHCECDLETVMTMILHDTLESAPDRWRDVYGIVPIGVFIRVLKLSKLEPAMSQEVYEYFSSDAVPNSPHIQLILDILERDPVRRKEILESRLQNEHDREIFQSMYDNYSDHLDQYCSDLSSEKKQAELDSLWHYLFFDEKDARHKYYDTRDNLKDIPQMEDDKRKKYILRRIPKLNALKFILNQHGLHLQADSLKKAWKAVGGDMDQFGYFVPSSRDRIMGAYDQSFPALVARLLTTSSPAALA